jgi:non-ribosomal peptide synthetase-like protein
MTRNVTDDSKERQRAADAPPRLLHQFFERQARSHPDRRAVECKGEALSYAELDALAERMSALLRARGVVPGSLVALYLEKSCRLFAAMLGVLKAGGGYVPLDPKFPAARVLDILDDADATVLITDRERGGELAPKTAAEVMFLDEDIALDLRSAAPSRPPATAPDDVCYVIYTSGSTGRPKGVVIEHRHAVNFVRSLRTVYRLTPQDRIYQGFSLAFDASVEEIWGALSIGGTLVVPDSEIARSAFDAAAFITAQKITYFSTVPSFLAMIASDLPTVRFLVLGGEACPQELVQRWATPARRLMNTYGPTEATVVATGADCHPDEPVTIGKPLPGYTVHVLDDQMRPVAPGETGELYIGGDSIARGYLHRPELTAERFIDNPLAKPNPAPGRLYRTRDLVRLTESGDLQFVGRADAQIKIRGFRIELSEIEAVLMEHPAIQAAAVNVVEFGNLKELAAYVVLDRGAGLLDRQGVDAMLRNRLPEYMVPRYLDVVDELPQMTSGKVDRKLLPPPRTILGRAEHDVVAPDNDLERAIVEVWEKVFKTSPVSVDDDFFLDLRGHSLFAAQAITELRSKLAIVNISVPDLYEYRTARRLAQHLEASGVSAASNPSAAAAAEAARSAARPPLPWFRFACAGLQFLGLLALYAAIFSPIVFGTVLVVMVRDGAIDVLRAINIATTVALLVWPSWLLLSIALKWLVIGRFRPGRYRVWGFYYFRWWLVTRFQGLSWSEMFVGTPLMSLYYRAMGAKVGRNCSIDTPHCAAFDLVSIGDDTSIGPETHLLGYRIEDGWLILGNVTIGSECFVGTHCCLGLDTRMENRSRLDDMSHLADGEAIAADQGMRGSPARPAAVDLDALQASAGPAKHRPGRAFLFGLAHLGLIYAMGYLLILSALPGLAMVIYAFLRFGPLWAAAAALAAVPVSFVWYLLVVVMVKRLAVGRIEPGVYRQQSKAYVRYWFLAYLLTNTRHIVLPLYATLYLPGFLRLLGASIGRGVEISTAMRIVPDLLTIEDGSFLADACMVGGHRSYLGLVEIPPNRIGRRSFIGNSAMVPVGVDIGDNGLIGVLSTPPPGVRRTPDGSRWLGSPGFELPNTQEVSEFGEQETYSPSRKLVVLRAAVELMRLMLPEIIAVLELMLFCAVVAVSYYLLPLWTLLIVGPCAAFVLSILAVAIVADVKNLLIGKFEPVVKPLWSAYVWLNDVVNALYETVAASAMAPLMGTPFIAPCLRMMGCKVGRWVFLETTLFSEFDLVEIGDRAALNLGATIQTHLFEDRVMKSDRLKIAEECSIANMAVVLYGTEMKRGASLGSLSVLMKGEVLPPETRWAGIPTRPVAPAIAPVRIAAAPAAEPVAAVPEKTAAPDKAAAPAKPPSREELIKARVDKLLSSLSAEARTGPSPNQPQRQPEREQAL